MPDGPKRLFAGACSNVAFVIDSRGQLFGVGQDKAGQLQKLMQSPEERIQEGLSVVGWTNGGILDIAVAHGLTILLTDNHEIYGAGDLRSKCGEAFELLKLPNDQKVKQIRAGFDRVAVLDFTGKVWIFSLSSVDKPTTVLGLPDNIARIALGYDFLLAQDEENVLWAQGSNEHGQIGLEHNERAVEATKVPFEGRGPFKDLAAGWDFSVLIDSDGGTWTCGNGKYGQTGHPLGEAANPRYDFLQRTFKKIEGTFLLERVNVGGFHVLGEDNQGRIWGWGITYRLGIKRGSKNYQLPTLLQGTGSCHEKEDISHMAASRFCSLFIHCNKSSLMVCGEPLYNCDDPEVNTAPPKSAASAIFI